MDYAEAVTALRRHADPIRAAHSGSYFKTGPGQYGEGDVFWGLKAANLHALARQFAALQRADVARLLTSEVHEQRMLGLLVLRRQFERAGKPRKGASPQSAAREQAAIYRVYVTHLDRVNNWDLVDGSAPYIVGAYLEHRSRKPVFAWARSRNLWRRRVAILAAFWWIRAGDFTDAIALAVLLINDREDLIHKAVGWMLREIDKRDHAVAVAFLRRHFDRLPRTTLRYAIERFPARQRQAALRGAF